MRRQTIYLELQGISSRAGKADTTGMSELTKTLNTAACRALARTWTALWAGNVAIVMIRLEYCVWNGNF